MNFFLKSPFLVFAFTFFVMWLAGRIGLFFRKRRDSLEEGTYEDLDVVVTATLTLLGLIIGFSFSMAISRYDERKNYEESEANAIGTEYVRADLLPAADAAKVRELLKQYVDERILFYRTRDEEELQQINSQTAQLQSALWSVVRAPSGAQPTPVLALVIAGMNDVLNSQGYTQAAWWNRIPTAAWLLMIAVAICSNMLLGYDSRRTKQEMVRMLVLPLVLSIAFLAIADIDSPRRGVIRVVPQNLVSLANSLNGH
jgi:hypothetical protein